MRSGSIQRWTTLLHLLIHAVELVFILGLSVMNVRNRQEIHRLAKVLVRSNGWDGSDPCGRSEQGQEEKNTRREDRDSKV